MRGQAGVQRQSVLPRQHLLERGSERRQPAQAVVHAGGGEIGGPRQPGAARGGGQLRDRLARALRVPSGAVMPQRLIAATSCV